MRLEMVGRMYRAGVRFVTGADSGINSYMDHGGLRNAATFLVAAGGSSAAALAASTSTAADACGVGTRKGFLRKGYDADVIIVDGDLQADIGALANVASVVLGGSLIG